MGRRRERRHNRGTYRIEPHEGGTRFTYEHTGFSGIGGFLVAKLVLGPVRRKMLDVGLPAVLAEADNDGILEAREHPQTDALS